MSDIQDRVVPTARADATRLSIVDAAERLFRTLGYQKTTVADIARELRMSPANVYRFFASKAAINEAICARILGGLDDLAWEVARRQEPAETRLPALFRLMQEQTMTLFFNEKRLHDMVAAALVEHWDTIDAHIHAIEGAIRHVVMDGQREGAFARLDPDQTSQLIHWATVGFTHPGLIAECRVPDDLPQAAAGMAEFVLRALRVNPRTDEC